MNDFTKIRSRINSNYSQKREEVDSSDRVPAALLLAWLCLMSERFATLQLHQATASLQMQSQGQTWTWAGRPYLPLEGGGKQDRAPRGTKQLCYSKRDSHLALLT